ncbi:tetratricopeptide repeat protein, partial [bacterium]|nr:tetratricopeptide repeat protein [bacterium]
RPSHLTHIASGSIGGHGDMSHDQEERPQRAHAGGRPPSAADVEGALLSRLGAGSEDPREIMWQLVCWYRRSERFEDALAFARKLAALADNPGERGLQLFTMGQIHECAGDYAAAAARYREAAGHEPADPNVWYLIHNNLGYCLAVLGHFTEAEEWCRRAARFDHGRANAHKNLGLALVAQARWVEAAEAFLLAAETDPADPRALQHLEDLLGSRPTLPDEVPDFDERLGEVLGAAERAQDPPRAHGA